jgi:hypothetical protein
MANWVSASTTDYWRDFDGGVTYLGGGYWECATGPSPTNFYEAWNSPFRPDPYYYTVTTIYGIRFNLSWNPTTSTNVGVRIFTNETGYSYYEQILNFPSGTTTNRQYLIEWEPVSGERILEIRIVGVGGEFGSYYGSTPVVSSIEVDTEGGDPEPEPSPCRWTSFVGTVEICE